MSEHYRRAGVDIDAGDEAVRRISRLVASTRTAGVTGAFGGFGGLFDPRAAGAGPDDLLVSGTDGVGTKLEIAFATGVHDTIGVDCVAMCVNDVLTVGARPLFFLDYLAVGKLEPGVVEAVVSGIADGCRQAGCALIGGETAEMPGFYRPGTYDVAGFTVGAVGRDAVVDGTATVPGDVLVGLPSSGLHSNGFSLVRHVLLAQAGHDLDAIVAPLDRPLGEVLLTPTRIYVGEVRAALGSIGGLSSMGGLRAMVHVTGGGLRDNVPRVLPEGLEPRFDGPALTRLRQPVFELIQREGGIPDDEMYRVFNMGVGYVLVVDPEAVDAWLRAFEGATIIGRVARAED